MEEGMLCYASSLLHPTEEESNNTELPLQSLKADGQQLSRRDFWVSFPYSHSNETEQWSLGLDSAQF